MAVRTPAFASLEAAITAPAALSSAVTATGLPRRDWFSDVAFGSAWAEEIPRDATRVARMVRDRSGSGPN